MYVLGAIILALAAIYVGMCWMMAHAPEGEEIPGVGFVRKEQQ